MEKVLSPSEVRVLGALIEKQVATPEYYPLTLNALLSACNQKTNRQPVVTYTEEVALRALDRLREKNLARVIYDGRAPKYSHAFTSELALERADVAVLCVLMLRGPQTSGEIRGRTGRLYEFNSLEEVERVLEGLADREAGALVVRLPVAPGSREARYAHLLSGPPRPELLQGPPQPHVVPPEPLPEDLPIPPSLAIHPHTAVETTPPPPANLPPELERLLRLEAEVHRLQEQLRNLQQDFDDFRRQFE